MSDLSTESTASQKPEPVVTISQEDGNIVVVIERFDVSAAQQSEALEQATDHITREWKGSPEFVAALLLRGRDLGSGVTVDSDLQQDSDNGGVTVYSQWQPSDSGSAPADVPGSWSLAAALPNFAKLDSRTYTVEFTDSATPPTRVSLADSPIAHFGIFSVPRENQDRLLELARENAPNSLKVTPGLISINFHRSLDGLQVINLGTWNSFDDFNSLHQHPGFASDSLYWEGVADFRPDFFDVVLVETGQ